MSLSGVVMIFLIIFGALNYGLCTARSLDTEADISDTDNPLIRLLLIQNATCDGVRWCTISVAATRTANQCCMTCSCDPDCYKTDNCCPDFEFGVHTNWSTHGSLEEFMAEYSRWTSSAKSNKTIAIMTLHNDRRRDCRRAQVGEPSRLRQDMGTYFMSSKCAIGTSVADLQRKCELDYLNKTEVIDNMQSYEDLMPVQSLDDGTVYKNKYCSMCSSAVEKTSTWSVSILCTLNQTPEPYYWYFQNPNTILYYLLESFQEPAKKLLRHCNIIFEPARDHVKFTKDNTCTLYDFETCPDNKHVESELCEQYASPVYIFTGPKNTKKVYKNAACLACNIDTNWKETTCSMLQNSRRVKMTLHVPKQMAGVSVTEPVDDRLHVVFPGISRYGCQAGELYDKTSAFCRKVFCPRGMFAFQGTCRYFFTQISGGSFIVFLKLTPKSKVTNHTEFASSVFSIFVKLDDMDTTVSIADHSVLGKRTKSSDFLVYLTFSSDVIHGTQSDVMNFIERVKTNKLSVTNRNHSIKINVSIADSVRPAFRSYLDLQDNDYYSILFPKGWRKQLVQVQFNINEGNRCYRVELNQSEYTWVSDALTHLRIKSTKKIVYDQMQFSAENPTRVLVCLNYVYGVEIMLHEEGIGETATNLVADDDADVEDYIELAVAPVLFCLTMVTLSITCAVRSRLSRRTPPRSTGQ